jgi:hypothetical protein
MDHPLAPPYAFFFLMAFLGPPFFAPAAFGMATTPTCRSRGRVCH